MGCSRRTRVYDFFCDEGDEGRERSERVKLLVTVVGDMLLSCETVALLLAPPHLVLFLLFFFPLSLDLGHLLPTHDLPILCSGASVKSKESGKYDDATKYKRNHQFLFVCKSEILHKVRKKRKLPSPPPWLFAIIICRSLRGRGGGSRFRVRRREGKGENVMKSEKEEEGGRGG